MLSIIYRTIKNASVETGSELYALGFGFLDK